MRSSGWELTEQATPAREARSQVLEVRKAERTARFSLTGWPGSVRGVAVTAQLASAEVSP
jgi:hypothetical protein